MRLPEISPPAPSFRLATAAGTEVALEDYRGIPDRDGRPLRSTVVAVADELAAAAGLLMRKEAGVPVVLISGFEWKSSEGCARDLLRPPDKDLFR